MSVAFDWKSLFTPPTAQQVAQAQLKEAQREQLVHEAAAKYHEAMSRYYRDMAAKLSSYSS